MKWSTCFHLLLPVCLATGLPLSSQTIVHSFDGDAGPGLVACQTLKGHCDRPDMDVAVNGTQVVQVTWQNLRVYDYSGHLLHTTPTAEMLRGAGLDPLPGHGKLPMPIEPHVVFDEFLRRWIMTATGEDDDLMVSATADASGAWGGVSLSCLGAGPCLDNDDAVHLGFDKNGVYYCGAHVGDLNLHTSHLGYDCFAVPSSEVAAVAQRTAPSHINRIHNLPLDVYPGIDHNPAKVATAPQFFRKRRLMAVCTVRFPAFILFV